MEAGKFPLAIQIGERRWAWPIDEILQYVESRPRVSFDPKPKKPPTRTGKVNARVKAPVPERKPPESTEPKLEPTPVVPSKRPRARL
jgi:hypothetical protein